jgi:hypothetical protein
VINIGELRAFRNGRNPITKEIIYILGLILEIHEDPDPISNVCKVLTGDGRVRWVTPHGSRSITNETG